MSSSGGFGPTGNDASELAPFVIGGPSQLTLDDSRTGTVAFSVSNVTGRPVRARIFVQPGAGTDVGWFLIAGEGPAPTGTWSAMTERGLPVSGTASIEVTVRVPDAAPAGAASFVLGAALEETPDQVVSGPTVAFEVSAARAKRKFPWWIAAVAAGALVVLVGGGALIWALIGPSSNDSPSTQTSADAGPTESAPPSEPPTEPPIEPPVEPPVADPSALVVSVDGLQLQAADGSVIDSVAFAAGTGELTAFLDDTFDATAEVEPFGEATTYGWAEAVGFFTDDSGAFIFVVSDDTAEGLRIRTTEGFTVGSSADSLAAYGAQPHVEDGVLTESYRLQSREVPFTRSREDPSRTGVEYILMWCYEGVVTGIWLPDNDYSADG